MNVYKATRSDMTCTLGRGKFQYRIGEVLTAEGSKCGKTGLHCCEYVLDCMGYYALDGKNRFFLAEAGGDINEDGKDTRISCTKLKLVQELDLKALCYHALAYMIEHPMREWKKSGTNLCVRSNLASGGEGALVIARGAEPRVRGKIGAALGLLQETETGVISARMLLVDGKKIFPDRWYSLDPEGLLRMEEVRHEAEAAC